MSVCRLFHGRVTPAVLTLTFLLSSIAFVRAATTLEEHPAPDTVRPAIRLLSPPDGAVLVDPGSLLLLAGLKDPAGMVEAVEFYSGETLLGTVRVPEVGPSGTEGESWLRHRDDPALGSLVLVEFDWSSPGSGELELWVLARDHEGPLARSDVAQVTILSIERVSVVTVFATHPVGSKGRLGEDGELHPEPVRFRIDRTGPGTGPLTVFFELGGTAIAGVDYEELSTSVTVPEGARSVEVVVMPIPDDVVDERRTIVLRLVPPPLADLWEADEEMYRVGRPSAARGVILGDDKDENRPPRLALLQPKRGEVFLAPATIRLIAGVWDADGAVKQVEFFANGRSLGTVFIPDPEPGVGVPPPVRYGLDWENVPAGRYVLTAVATDDQGASAESQPVWIRVVDRQRPPVVTVIATDPVASEPEPSSETRPDTGTFAVFRTGPTTEPLTVFYRLGGTARNGVDYQFLPGHVVIPAGSSSAEVIVVPLADDLAEGTETVILRLWPPHLLSDAEGPAVDYLVGEPGVARILILDADSAENLSPRAKIVRPVEGQVFLAPEAIAIGVVAMDPDGYVTTVEWFAGREKIGEEHLAFIQPPPPGERQTFRFRWIDPPAGRHELRVRVTDERGAEAWSDSVRIAVLNTRLLPVVTVEAIDPIASRPGLLTVVDPAVFVVRRTGDLRDPLTVEYTLGGTAENGIDYLRLSGEVTIPAGRAGARIEVIPLDNPDAAGDKTVLLRLQAPVCPAIHPPPPGCYMVGVPGKARAAILDRPVSRPSPPRIELVRPQAKSVFQAPAEILIVAQTFDADGWVKHVEFYANGELIGRQAADPTLRHGPAERQAFRWLWTGADPGRHVIEARATDNDGLAGMSPPVTIGVLAPDEPPIVRIHSIDGPEFGVRPHDDEDEHRIQTATFAVTRTGGTDHPLTVHYRVGGTAIGGEDYVALPGHVTIGAGQRAARIVVQPLKPSSTDRVRTVRVCLVPPPVEGLVELYQVGDPRCAAVLLEEHTPPEPPLMRLPDGSVRAMFPGNDGEVYRLEISDRLDEWRPVAEVLARDGSVRYLDPEASGRGHRFYRLRPVVPEVLERGFDPSLGAW